MSTDIVLVIPLLAGVAVVIYVYVDTACCLRCFRRWEFVAANSLAGHSVRVRCPKCVAKREWSDA